MASLILWQIRAPAESPLTHNKQQRAGFSSWQQYLPLSNPWNVDTWVCLRTFCMGTVWPVSEVGGGGHSCLEMIKWSMQTYYMNAKFPFYPLAPWKRAALTACQCWKHLDQTDAATLGSGDQGEIHTTVEETGWEFSNVAFLAENQ